MAQRKWAVAGTLGAGGGRREEEDHREEVRGWSYTHPLTVVGGACRQCHSGF